jgi:hypothetical protein
MTKQNRESLKQYFLTGKTPTEGQFADLIDSAINQVEDSLNADANGQVGIGTPAPSANLNVRGRLFTPLKGTVSVVAGSKDLFGVGTSFDDELAVGDAVRIGQEVFTIGGISDAAHAVLGVAAATTSNAANAYRDVNLLLVENGDGVPQLVIDKSGNVGIGIVSPVVKLHVGGKIIATQLAGDGEGLTNLQASSLAGLVSLAQLPDLPAQKITGQLSPEQLPPGVGGGGGVFKGKLDKAITGTVSTDSASTSVTGDGTLFKTELNPGDALKIGSEVFTVASIQDNQHLKLDRNPLQGATAVNATSDGEVLSVQTGNALLRLAVDKSGTLIWPLRGGKAASIGTWLGLDPGSTVAVAGPKGFLHCSEDNQWCLIWEPGGAVAVRGLLKTYGNLDLRGSLGIGSPAANKASLSIKGRTSVSLKGTVTALATSAAVQGSDTQFVEELKAGYSIQFDSATYTVKSIEDATHLTIDRAHFRDVSNVPAQTNGPLVLFTDPSGANPFSIDGVGNVGVGVAQPRAKLEISGAGGATVLSAGASSGSTCDVSLAGHVQLRQFGSSKRAYLQARDDSDPSAIGLVVRVQQAGEAGKQRYFEAVTINENGNIGIGVPPSDARLHVPGTLRADRIQGSGAGITEIAAANISGQLKVEQIPDLPASKITGLVPSTGGRPVLATGNVALGATQNIYNIPVPSQANVAAYYSLEIYTMVWWFDGHQSGGGMTRDDYHVMTRTTVAGAVYNVQNTSFPVQIEPMSLSPTQTNHPEPKFPTVSFAVVNENRQAWLQIKTTAGTSRWGNNQPVTFHIYSLL